MKKTEDIVSCVLSLEMVIRMVQQGEIFQDNDSKVEMVMPLSLHAAESSIGEFEIRFYGCGTVTVEKMTLRTRPKTI